MAKLFHFKIVVCSFETWNSSEEIFLLASAVLAMFGSIEKHIATLKADLLGIEKDLKYTEFKYFIAPRKLNFDNDEAINSTTTAIYGITHALKRDEHESTTPRKARLEKTPQSTISRTSMVLMSIAILLYYVFLLSSKSQVIF